MNLVWKYAPYDGGTLLVLLALADWADDSGYCYPKVAAIARKARLGQRQTNNVLKLLANDDVVPLVQRGGGSGKPTGRRINLEMLKPASVNLDSLKSGSKNPEIYDNAIRMNRQEPSDISSKPNSSDDDPDLLAHLQTVWTHYLEKTERNPKTYEFTSIRKKKGMARLRECLKKTGGDIGKAVELMKLATTKLAASDFHMGRDTKTGGKRYCEFEQHLFKSYEQMERWWNA
jgi:helix-turn-helix protein